MMDYFFLCVCVCGGGGGAKGMLPPSQIIGGCPPVPPPPPPPLSPPSSYAYVGRKIFISVPVATKMHLEIVQSRVKQFLKKQSGQAGPRSAIGRTPDS